MEPHILCFYLLNLATLHLEFPLVGYYNNCYNAAVNISMQAFGVGTHAFCNLEKPLKIK